MAGWIRKTAVGLPVRPRRSATTDNPTAQALAWGA